MKKYLLAAMALTALSGVPAIAQDASEQKPVAPAAIQSAPPQTPAAAPVAPVVVPPAEEKNRPRDAISGKPVADAQNPMKAEQKEQSLRDRVRGEMKSR